MKMMESTHLSSLLFLVFNKLDQRPFCFKERPKDFLLHRG